MPRRKLTPASNGHDDTVPLPAVRKSKAHVPIIKRGRELDMAIMEREIGRVLEAMPIVGYYGHLRLASDNTVADLARAVETYEAATSGSG